jgi:hypothetical protein
MRFLRLLGWLVLGLIGLAVLAVLLDEQSTQFQVRRVDNLFRNDGQGLEIVNIGQTQVTIKNVQVNERPECSAKPTLALGSRGGEFPMTLNVGDKVTVVGNCRAI